MEPISPNLKFLISKFPILITTRLDSSNYILWKSQVTSVLNAHGFLGHVDGTLSSPSSTIPDPLSTDEEPLPPIPNPKFQEWLITDQHLCICLQTTLTTSALGVILGVTSSRLLWTKLEQRYANLSEGHIELLHDKINNLTMGDESMTAYLDRAKAIYDQLQTAGPDTITTRQVLRQTLHGLPPAYNSFRVMARNRGIPFTVEELWSSLLAEEANMLLQRQASSPVSENSSALFTNFGRRDNSTRHPRNISHNRGGRGRGASHLGHTRPPFQSAPTSQTTSASGRSPAQNGLTRRRIPTDSMGRPIPCQVCGKQNHHTLNCFWIHEHVHKPEANISQSTPSEEANWFLDTGATDHITSTAGHLESMTPYTGNKRITVGTGAAALVANIGSSSISSLRSPLTLLDILHAPEFSKNLLSVYKFTKDNNCLITFSSTGFAVQDIKTGQIILHGPSRNGLYPIPPEPVSLFASCSSGDLWHTRLGHPASPIISKIASKLPVKLSPLSSCSHCSMSKSHKLPFPLSESRSTSPLALIHSDVWGPAPVESIKGYKFYVSFIDDFSRYTWLYPLYHKSDVFSAFQSFQTMVERQFTTKIKIFRSDGGGEFVNKQFSSLFQRLGIIHQTSAPYTPEQNGVAERKHRHIIETTLALLLTAHMPKQHWPDAAKTAVYLINRLPSSTQQNKSPLEVLHHQLPDYQRLRTFGCLCFPCLRPYARDKLEPRSQPCVFLGYADNMKAYKCMEVKTRRIYLTRHVQFVEHIFPYSQPVTTPQSTPQTTPPVSSTSDPYPDASPEAPLPPTPPPPPPDPPSPTPIPQQPPHQPTQQQPQHPEANIPVSPPPTPPPVHPTPPTTLPTHPMTTRSMVGTFRPRQPLNLHAALTSEEPISFKEASKHPHWVAAMQSEFDALNQQQTWDLVAPPPTSNIIGCKWVYKIKRDTMGSIARYKARLVAKGFHQKEGLDYAETFSPVAKHGSIRLLIALALHFGWPIKQLDVSNAFLHGHITEDLYMEQPVGFVDPSFPHHVCKLRKALYGLKQAPRQWYARFSTFLRQHGFNPSTADSSLFIRHSGGQTTVILLYVDDILITGTSTSYIQQFITLLSQEFSLKDLGDLSYFLGLEIQRHRNGSFVHQTKYTKDLLQRAGLTNCKPARTPVSAKLSSIHSDPPLSDGSYYRSIVGALQYLTLTRPDIAFAVNQVCQFLHSPRESHLTAAKRILRYLQYTPTHGILLRPSPLSLLAFSDADWAGDPVDRRSISGFCVFLGQNPLTWSAKKQSSISHSSTESEYRSLSLTAKEIIWLQLLLTDLKIPLQDTPLVWCDNQSAISLSSNPVFHSRTKHFTVDYHFIREQVTSNKLRVRHISTADNPADIFTKSLPTARFELLRDKLFVISAAQFAGAYKDIKSNPLPKGTMQPLMEPLLPLPKGAMQPLLPLPTGAMQHQFQHPMQHISPRDTSPRDTHVHSKRHPL